MALMRCGEQSFDSEDVCKNDASAVVARILGGSEAGKSAMILVDGAFCCCAQRRPLLVASDFC